MSPWFITSYVVVIIMMEYFPHIERYKDGKVKGTYFVVYSCIFQYEESTPS